MPYVLPVLDSVPRALVRAHHGISAAERAANSSAAPLPGVPRRSRTPSNNPANVRIGFTLVPPTPENETDGPTSALRSSPGFSNSTGLAGPNMIATLASPTALLHVSSSTPLPRLALGPRARRVRARESCDSLNTRDSVVFPSSPASDPAVLADASNAPKCPNYVLAPADSPSPVPKHLPINSGKNGALRLSMEAIKAALAPEMRRAQSDKSYDGTTTPGSTTSSLRKKSGELVKPSLKHAHTFSGGFPTSKTCSRSAPATPNPKFVHFDAQLEHVRLFLAEQKPLAVSRDGSPTETSEGEGNEFPWTGQNAYAGSYNSSDDERARRTVRIKSTNVPAHPAIGGADVRVQSLVLGDDKASLVGRVHVRNLAFEKWVAVRFTFDWWQTTSEVSARYMNTVADGIDCFGFTIKLGDVLPRIEEKTLFVAVRYTVAGKEIWDSNNGANYAVSFAKEEVKPKAANAWTANNGWSTKSKSRDQMSDLRKSLEKVMKDEDNDVPQLQIKGGRARQHTRGMSFGGFEAKPTVTSIVAAEPKPVPAPAPAKFGARYDFGAAPRERPSADTFRMPALGADSFKRPEARRAVSGDVPKVSTDFPKPEMKVCGSPRDLEHSMQLKMAPVEPLVRSAGFDEQAAAPSRRHHHRAAYFDAWAFPAAGVKRTPSGAPNVEELASERPAIPASWMDVAELGGSVASTPSVTSASSPSQSPSSPPEYLPSPDIDGDLDGSPRMLDASRSDMDPSNYSSFLDRFCFFTGPATERRTHTRSSSEGDYFGGGYGLDTMQYSESTARTLRAVSSSLSMSSDVATTPRAGTPVGGFETPLPVIAPALH
ncbi:hypothetical protein BDV93DRAFT_509083 [Ceratobasidium sp. AG-I]|nr:hypothetical protein BDV93DRAFT_509083 [Ceratobasidium sp. AG-I]